MSDDVTLTHPDADEPITVSARRARILVRQGWQDEGAAAQTSTPPPGATVPVLPPPPSLED